MKALHIAVVDDDAIFREHVSYLLAEAGGYLVKQAADGASLLAILAAHPIDCIVLDYNLEAETGLAISDRLAKKFPDPPPIVMLTGEGSERTAIKAFRSGFSDYVSKRCFELEELVHAIERAVERTMVAQERRRRRRGSR